MAETRDNGYVYDKLLKREREVDIHTLMASMFCLAEAVAAAAAGPVVAAPAR